MNPNSEQQKIQSITSTGSQLMADVNEDGFDNEDLARLTLNQSFDMNSQEGRILKIQNFLSLHSGELAKALKEVGDEAGLVALQNGDLAGIHQSVLNIVFPKKKMKEGGTLEEGDDIAVVRIGKKTYNCLIAESDEEKEIGLSNTESMEDNEGMLFIYEEPQHLDFWMKDCDLTLSIIFIDENKTVISNQKGLPNTEDFISADNAKYVLEVNYTEEIQPGDKVIFNLGEELEMEPDKLYILSEDGSIQAELDAGCRIFSIKSTQVMIRKAKKADESKSDVDYKDLGRYVFNELDRQEKRDPEYVEE
jgi:uncharacterized membrane protein (UPF0127 family)